MQNENVLVIQEDEVYDKKYGKFDSDAIWVSVMLESRFSKVSVVDWEFEDRLPKSVQIIRPTVLRTTNVKLR